MTIRTAEDLIIFKRQYFSKKRMKLLLSDCIFQNIQKNKMVSEIKVLSNEQKDSYTKHQG